jgi:transcriptional regulator with XRE-family HTH domain
VIITHTIIVFVIKSRHIYYTGKNAMSDRNIIGSRVKYFRKLRKFTQGELAAKLNIMGINIDRPMISRIECQLREITDIEIWALSKVLNISVDDLFEDSKGGHTE